MSLCLNSVIWSQVSASEADSKIVMLPHKHPAWPQKSIDHLILKYIPTVDIYQGKSYFWFPG